nr:MAG TPA: hypothetical protein [Caudoviricetes sp.]
MIIDYTLQGNLSTPKIYSITMQGNFLLYKVIFICIIRINGR